MGEKNVCEILNEDIEWSGLKELTIQNYNRIDLISIGRK